MCHHMLPTPKRSENTGLQIRVFLALLLTLALAYLAYLPGLSGPFLLDDFQIKELHLQSLQPTEIVKTSRRSIRFAGFSRSLTNASFAITGYIYGFENAAPFKQHNLLLHLLNGTLIFWLALLLLKTRTADTTTPLLGALTVAALWLLHPLQLSTVLYVVQRLVLLSALFTLATLVIYIKGRILIQEKPLVGTLVMSSAFTMLWPVALLSKENAALIPIYVILIEFFFFSCASLTGRSRRLFWAIQALFIGIPVAAGLAYFLTHTDTLLAGYAGRDFDMSERLLTQAHAIWFYVSSYVAPIPGRMSLFHDAFPIQRTLDVPTLVAITGILVLILLAVAVRRCTPEVGFGILWFFACHSLESTILPLEIVFEHRNYLAIFGLTLAIVSIGFRFARSPSLTKPLVGALAALAIILTLNTTARAQVWSNQLVLFATDFQDNPNSTRLLEGMYLWHNRLGKPGQARTYLERLRELNPKSAAADLLEIRGSCGSQTLSPALLRSARAGLQAGELSAFEMNGLLIVANKVMRDSCPAIEPPELFQLTETAVANQNVHTVGIRIISLTTGGVGAANLRNWDRSDAYFAEALSISKKLSPKRFKEVLEQAAFTYFRFGGKKQLQRLLDYVAQIHGQYIAANKISVNLTVEVRPSIFDPKGG